MILYKGRLFSNQEAIEFAQSIERGYDMVTLMFESKNSLTCFLSCEGEVCSKYFTCSNEDEKEEFIKLAEDNRVSISWL